MKISNQEDALKLTRKFMFIHVNNKLALVYYINKINFPIDEMILNVSGNICSDELEHVYRMILYWTRVASKFL